MGRLRRQKLGIHPDQSEFPHQAPCLVEEQDLWNGGWQLPEQRSGGTQMATSDSRNNSRAFKGRFFGEGLQHTNLVSPLRGNSVLCVLQSPQCGQNH